MYLHIGKDTIINSKNIIAIFNVEVITKKDSIENICKNLKIGDNIIDVSDGKQKSLVIVKKADEMKAYVSNVSTITLAKRTSKMEVE